VIEWTRATNATEALMGEFEAEAELYANLLRLFDREIAREPSSAAPTRGETVRSSSTACAGSSSAWRRRSR